MEKKRKTYNECLDVVKTVLGLNAYKFAKAAIYVDSDQGKYLQVRDDIAKKILEALEIR